MPTYPIQPALNSVIAPSFVQGLGCHPEPIENASYLQRVTALNQNLLYAATTAANLPVWKTGHN
ncbi:MAG: hypothetical protein Hals2KO_26490 [Halioglobus sp.]